MLTPGYCFGKISEIEQTKKDILSSKSIFSKSMLDFVKNEKITWEQKYNEAIKQANENLKIVYLYDPKVRS